MFPTNSCPSNDTTEEVIFARVREGIAFLILCAKKHSNSNRSRNRLPLVQMLLESDKHIPDTAILVAWSGEFIMLWLYAQPCFLDFNIFGVNLQNIFQIQPINLSVTKN